ncbi:helix-turn-helix domain-containing protein [[Clostridium] colinum]|uniref:helix-turn-helix domain-containing protein n=1 Tax=[Clostridium] colinum TaxID=36835 RepID=UPI0020243E44|nr:helix-turn-helix transcriptional regulator [[Clostridium] colinum]
MEIYERIVLLRRELIKNSNGKKLSQAEFAKKIGVSRDVIGNIEYNRAPIKEHMLKLICQTFNVNEDWLRNGNEPIFIENSNDILEEFLKKYELSEFMSNIVRRYLNLSPEYQQMFEKFIKEMVKELNSSENSKKEIIPNINEFKKQEKPKQEQELVQIIARGEGVTYITKEEFEELKRNSTMIDPEDYDKYF